MRVSQEEKDRSHHRIVEAAAKIVRERGVEATNLADVMKEAGLTHGGFYRHFETKDALLTSALESSFQETLARIQHCMEHAEPEQAAADFKKYYLSQGHVENPRLGCPVAALGGEIGRGLKSLRVAFNAGVKSIVAALAPGYKGSARAKKDKAMRELATMAGAVMIARACDPETALEVLQACLGNGGDPERQDSPSVRRNSRGGSQ